MSDDVIDIDSELPTIKRYQVSVDPDSVVSPPPKLKRAPPESESSYYSPHKKRFLEQSQPQILSPTYRASQIHGNASPDTLKELCTWAAQDRSPEPDWIRSHRPSTEGDETKHEIKIEEGSLNDDRGYSSTVLKMMKGMGYKEGTGLGKEGQGITEPVKAANQKGHRGLGHYTEGFKETADDWKEKPVSTNVVLEWMKKPTHELDETFYRSPSIQQLIGPRKSTVEDETQFVSSQIIQGVIEAKTIFDRLPDKDLREARTRSNPFEAIASVIFQNRAAMKMAEIDTLSGFAFSQKNKTYDNMPLLYFGDICAGPGGFSEYILWRTQWHAKGFGLTLKAATDASDFKLGKFLMGPPECFEPYYGVEGADGDGDILKPENLEEFKDYVLRQTDGEGLHFVMGDGGISVEGQENIQEILTKQLLLCQFACALSVLRQDGVFVCKTFDLYTPFSVGLVHLLRYAFERVAIIKPLTSRPANSERYVLCVGCKKRVARLLYDYLFRLNMEMRKLADTDKDIQDVVPSSHYIADSEFCRYMTRSNDSIGKEQIYNLQKLRAYVRNQGLRVSNQQEIREVCLKRWEVPNEMRKRRHREAPMETAERLLDSSLFRGSPRILDMENVGMFSSRYSWKCHLNYGKPILLLGQGFKNVFYFNGDTKIWMKDPHIQIELPKDTIVEGQVVEVFSGENNSLRTFSVLLTDAVVIGGQQVFHKPYSERQILLDKMVQATHKPSAKKWQDLIAVKPLLYRLENFYDLTRTLRKEQFKGHSTPRLAQCSHDRKMLVHGLTFIRHIKEPWNMELSNKLKKFYFFNCKTRSSQYEWPSEAAADFGYTRLSSLYWHWDPTIWAQILQTDGAVSDRLLDSFLNKVQPHKPKVT